MGKSAHKHTTKNQPQQNCSCEFSLIDEKFRGKAMKATLNGIDEDDDVDYEEKENEWQEIEPIAEEESSKQQYLSGSDLPRCQCRRHAVRIR